MRGIKPLELCLDPFQSLRHRHQAKDHEMPRDAPKLFSSQAQLRLEASDVSELPIFDLFAAPASRLEHSGAGREPFRRSGPFSGEISAMALGLLGGVELRLQCNST